MAFILQRPRLALNGLGHEPTRSQEESQRLIPAFMLGDGRLLARLDKNSEERR